MDIPLVRQNPKSDDRLRCCALMLFNYYGNRVSREEIWRRLHVYKKHSGLWGAYLCDLGKFATKKGFSSTIFLYDWHFWNQESADACQKSAKACVASLTDLKKEKVGWGDQKVITKEINYVNAGGKFIFDFPSLTTVDGFIQKNVPVIVNVWGQDVYKNHKENYIHSILVVGKVGNNYLVRDPYLAVEEIAKDHLDFMIKRNSGWMMVIEPKPDTSKLKQEVLKF